MSEEGAPVCGGLQVLLAFLTDHLQEQLSPAQHALLGTSVVHTSVSRQALQTATCTLNLVVLCPSFCTLNPCSGWYHVGSQCAAARGQVPQPPAGEARAGQTHHLQR